MKEYRKCKEAFRYLGFFHGLRHREKLSFSLYNQSAKGCRGEWVHHEITMLWFAGSSVKIDYHEMLWQYHIDMHDAAELVHSSCWRGLADLVAAAVIGGAG